MICDAEGNALLLHAFQTLCHRRFLLLFLLGLDGLVTILLCELECLFEVVAEVLLDLRLIRFGDAVEDHDGDDRAGVGTDSSNPARRVSRPSSRGTA